MQIRSKLAAWLFPDLVAEVYRQAMFQEAMFDILALRIPMAPAILDEAIANCTALQEDLQAGRIGLKDRAMSLITVLEKKGIAKRKEATCHQ